MTTLNELANQAKAEIAAGDKSRANADDHYGSAGRALTAAKKKVKHGNWLPWLKANVSIGERRARELMEIGARKKTVAEVREIHRKSNKAKRNHGADLPSDKPGACDYDWSNVQEADFGSPSKAYRAQAQHYRNEAINLASSYPLLSAKVDLSIVTESEIQAVRKVAQAWLDLANRLAQRKMKESA